MYKVSVPVTAFTLDNYDKNETVKMLREFNAERVFICPDSKAILSTEKQAEAIASLKENVTFMKSQGFETGVWIWALNSDDEKYIHMTNADGKADEITVCPTDVEYSSHMGKFIELAAGTEPDIIMFDDDFRFGYHSIGFGCCCKNHLAMISDEVGENVTLETMKQALLYGGKNKYRDAFIKCNGISLESFARQMRAHVDNVNPEIRLGYCSCITNWDIDGTTPDRIAEIFAGNTKPFYRLIGAPYWHALNHIWGNRLADIVELERIEASRRINKGIEMFSEGDAYPRPRFNTPAACLECFDMGLRVAGCTDGILKYGIDYCSSPDYERGYVEAHIRHRETYKKIAAMFDGKTSVGVRVYDKTPKYADTVIPQDYEGRYDLQDYAFNYASRMLDDCAIPIVYEGDGAGAVAFGEDVKAVPDDKLSGLITDLRGAEILTEKGIDCGLTGVGEYKTASRERYSDGENVSLMGRAKFRCAEVNSDAVIESEFITTKKESYPASYRYENKDGQRFLILCFDGYFCDELLFRQYTRAKQIDKAVKWLTGKQIPAISFGHPDLYIQAKEKDGALAVALINTSHDEIYGAEVILDRVGEITGAIDCNVTVKGNTVTVDYLKPFGFAAFEIK